MPIEPNRHDNIEVLDTQLSPKGQFACLHEYLRLKDGRKIHLFLGTDRQRQPYAELWDGQKWNRIAAIESACMASPANAGYGDGATAANFSTDRARLLDLVIAILD